MDLYDFSIQYELFRGGWAIATFEQGTTKVAMTASYLHDSLRQMTDAALRLCKGDESALVVFMDEPGEHQVHISREEEGLRMEVRWYADWESWSSGPLARYKTITTFNTSSARFRHQVLEVLNKLYVEVGVEDYKEQWVRAEFPMDSYYRLASRRLE